MKEEKIADIDQLMTGFKEARQLLQAPGAEGHYEKASQLLVWITRHSPNAGIADLAMLAVSRAYRCRKAIGPDVDLNADLDRLGYALEIAAQKKIDPSGGRV